MKVALGTLLVIASLALTSQNVLADEKPHLHTAPIFAGIAWGTSADDVKRKLSAKGFHFDKETQEHDYAFSGTIDYEHVAIVEMFNPARNLVKTSIYFLTADEDCRDEYLHLTSLLTKKYGPPTEIVAKFDEPFKEGDGKFNEAVHDHKAHFVQYWSGPIGERSSLDAAIEENLTVTIDYESSAWKDEHLRREPSGTENL